MLLLIAIFLLTAVILVPIFRRLQLGSVLGYIAAGIVIGPWGLGLIPETLDTLHVAELGIVLLLFLVGLELEPSRLWALAPLGVRLGRRAGPLVRRRARRGGACARARLAARARRRLRARDVVDGDRARLARRARRALLPRGRKTFAVLLFQDLAVIPLIALLPLLSPDKGGAHESGWIVAAKSFAAIAVVVIGSRLVTRPALTLIARYGGREVFTAAALLVVIGAALIMESIGLSMSLGAFLAGVLLADSEFRHELEADVEPFKGLLLGLFFMAVGMSANLTLLHGAAVGGARRSARLARRQGRPDVRHRARDRHRERRRAAGGGLARAGRRVRLRAVRRGAQRRHPGAARARSSWCSP